MMIIAMPQSTPIIEVRVVRELGYKHPSGDLAIKLRKEAK